MNARQIAIIANRKKKPKMTELEKRIVAAQKAGQAWAVADGRYFLLDETKKSVLADLMRESDVEGNTSEAKLERMARSSDEWKKFVAGLAAAKTAALSARVRHESLIAWYEAERTKESTRRTEIARGLFSEGN